MKLQDTTEGIPNLHLLCAFGARTATIALLSIVVMIAQNLRYFLVILLMNLFREDFEKFIDPTTYPRKCPITANGRFHNAYRDYSHRTLGIYRNVQDCEASG